MTPLFVCLFAEGVSSVHGVQKPISPQGLTNISVKEEKKDWLKVLHLS